MDNVLYRHGKVAELSALLLRGKGGKRLLFPGPGGKRARVVGIYQNGDPARFIAAAG